MATNGSVIDFYLPFTVAKEDTSYDFSFLKMYWYLYCGVTYGLSWRTFHVYLRKMCILLLLSGVIYIWLLGLVG